MIDRKYNGPLTAIAVRLYGPNIDPDQLTSILNINPTQAHKLGDPHKLPDGKIIYRKNGIWFFKHEAYSADVDKEFGVFCDKITHVLSLLKAKGLSFEKLPGVTEAFLSLLIIGGEGSENRTEQVVKLSPASIALLGDLNLKFEITLLWGGE